MITKFVEVSNTFNWGKFLVCRFTPEEWAVRSEVDPGQRLLAGRGWSQQHLWVLDLQTGEGAYFRPGGLAKADLERHRIWVCPMYEVFLGVLYAHPEWCDDITKIPSFVKLEGEEARQASAVYGHRREGPDAKERDKVAKPRRKKA